MSILSDRQIKNLAGIPETVVHGESWSPIEYFSGPPLEYFSNPITRNEANYIHNCNQTERYDPAIHSDFKQMIEPFIPNQVRNERTLQVQKDLYQCLEEIKECKDKLQKLGDITRDIELYRQHTALSDDLASLNRRVDILNMNPCIKVISYGLSAFGYDIRLAPEYKIASNVTSGIIDPKNPDEKVWVDQEGDSVLIPPNGFMLSRSLEYICMPKNVLAIVLSKSTYARSGINCLATPLEPGWEGHITLEYANTTPNPVKMYGGEGCAQLIFFQGEEAMTPYDTARKYFGQRGITLAKM